MPERELKITSNSLISIGLLIVVVGAVYMLATERTAAWSAIKANADAITASATANQELSRTLNTSIVPRLVRVETLCGSKEAKSDHSIGNRADSEAVDRPGG